MQLSADGSLLLAGYSGRLYNTDGSGVLQLSVSGDQGSGSLLSTSNLGGNPTMNSTGSRLLYLSGDDNGIGSQFATLDVNPSSLGADPQITNPSVPQDWVLNNGGSPMVSASVASAANSVIREVNSVTLDQGLYDANVQHLLLSPTANSQVYSNGGLSASTQAAPGPRTLRVKSEIKDTAGLRHATAIDFAPFFVVKTAPTGTPAIASLSRRVERPAQP